ncbi:hypothetical protein LRB90_01720 [Borreliella burgdorferi]|uniref:hypothetical protein n=1 Tax=Borreliella burgdorferi TaxID=139 RepID=UPI0001949177|nr:hypothetical protein [Borreliella burgdorferi]ACN24200.1 conserved hypothetical protein [Borreliella burgdorferi 64b]ADQ29997.1 conserved hypothetical protein [Borreliella burgdorferi N40]MCD2411727.1 hypothetical protein [Borreliella burgdorferi]PRQ90822.1 hypothetical protein CV691_05730 [Borreliella burgdorferi]PRR13554.1 hypothetical protein CV656_06180 [Borreliella burgdorferi]
MLLLPVYLVVNLGKLLKILVFATKEYANGKGKIMILMLLGAISSMAYNEFE